MPEAGAHPPSREVTVWLAALDAGPVAIATLSVAEREHLGGLTSERARRRYGRTRTVLRGLLGSSLGVAPATVALAVATDGKPRLAGEGDPGVRFNLSHAGDLLAIAVAEGCEVGVDVESLAARRQVLDGTLTATERARLDALPPERRTAEFLRGWTRKEAYLKGVGCGIRVPLDQLDLAPARAGHRPTALPPALATEGDWTVVDLPLADDHVGAVAVPGSAPRVVVRRWVG